MEVTWWHVYTDGSAQMGASSVRGSRHPGGWAAVVEHGSDGYVIRGREAETTNTRMELTAVIRGLDSIEEGQDVCVHTDCMAVFSIRERHIRGNLAVSLGKDRDLWIEVGRQFGRVRRLELRQVVRGGHPIHRRAHKIAATEGKAQAAGLAADMTVLARIEKKERRRYAEQQEARRRKVELLTDDRGRPFAVEQAFHDALSRRHR